MIGKYIKNSSGRGVVLGDTTIIRQIREREELQDRIASLQTQIDKLNERLLSLEKGKKD
jgi:hypothetical protein